MDSPSAAPFDPYIQNITLKLPDGTDEFSFPTTDLAAFNTQNIDLGLVYGAQFGLNILMMVTVLLLTQPGKRHSPIYVLNIAALFFDILRTTMLVVWLHSLYNNPYAFFSNDNSRYTSHDLANGIAAVVFKFIEITIIMLSLIFQVRVIMSTATRAQRAVVTIAAAIVGLITISLHFALMVVNAQNIIDSAQPEAQSLQTKLADSAAIMQVVSVGFYLIIFSTKLGIAIKQRIRLGHSKFGPMQMVFIGTLQSMFIPMIFQAVGFSRYLDFASLATTILVVQLPLTALWASTSLEERMNAGEKKSAKQQQKRFLAMHSPKSSRDYGKGKSSAMDDSYGPLSPGESSVSGASSYRLAEIPENRTTIGSLDVNVKMNERDMV